MKRISRRTALKGLGVSVALPYLEGMSLGAHSTQNPRRIAFFFVPNGIHMPTWTPTSEGMDFTWPETIRSLEPLREKITILSGLAQGKARANGDGPGDHARSAATFLTGVQAYKSTGSQIRVGVSVDQVAAKAIGHETRFRSLEIGGEKGRESGQCDSGYACAYSNNISWASAQTPLTKEIDPRRLFDRLFSVRSKGKNPEERAEIQRSRRSLLDFVLEDAKDLHRTLGQGDRHKVDEYLSGVRELERRIEKAEEADGFVLEKESKSALRPPSKPESFQRRIELLMEVLALAFQTDSTRVATFMMANEGSNQVYKHLGAPEGHHALSHHREDALKIETIFKINQFHVDLFAKFLQKLKQTKEGDSNLLDQSLIVYGAGISDGNRHKHHDLPFLIAGSGGGRITTGLHRKYPEETPAMNLYLSLLQAMDVHTPRLGDSTGFLPGLLYPREPV